MDDQYPVGEMDLIFCRNVLIYFERPIQEQVIRRLIDHLLPEGYLFLGHSVPLGSIARELLQASVR